ncbi:MAG: DUF1150 family protein [Rhizobiaceae bacterium]|nr:DUF1150 family protein [Rhizobiaceae bacterium]
MFQDQTSQNFDQQAFAQMGNEAVAYMRKITSREIKDKFMQIDNIKPGHVYWALFAADGALLMIAEDQSDLLNQAFYNDLTAVNPN